MNVDIQSLGFPTTDALSGHAKRRLRFVLARHSDRIARVSMRLGDCNGPRGGMDKFCRVQVHLIDAPVAVIHDIGADLYEVIDRAADRAGRTVVKHLDRARSFARHGRAGAAANLGSGNNSQRQAATHASTSAAHE
ncbi:hypothetical protein BH11PSE8_BH11PSE8_01220 [soil metagenome]